MADPPEADPVFGLPSYAADLWRRRTGAHHFPYASNESSSPHEVGHDVGHDVADVVSLLGIPAEFLTPEVRAAVLLLMDEIGRLHGESVRAAHFQEFLEQQSNLDSVLSIINRRALMRELGARVMRTSVAGALAYFHLDSYESLRRLYGLAAAEAALRLVATTLVASVRDSDLVGGISGGGIGVVLAVTETPGAITKVGALLEELHELPFSWGDLNLTLVVSCGLHEFGPGETAEEILAAADVALRLSPLLSKGER